MLCRIGIMVALLSMVFVGGSVLIPMLMAAVGATLFVLGKEIEDGK